MKMGIVVPEGLQRLIAERALGEPSVARALEGYILKFDLSRVSQAMLELSDRFNRIDETLGGDYMESEGHRAAYLLYFLPANFAKASVVLSELAPTFAGRESLSILDMGSGPASMSLAALDTLGRLPGVARIDFTVMDSSRGALEDGAFLLRRYAADAFAEANAPKLVVSTAVTDLETAAFSDRRWDLIIIGDTLNELHRGTARPAASHAAFLENLAGNLADDGSLVVIEPSLKSIALRLQAVRDIVAEKPGLCVRAPCLRQGPCPMLSEDHERDWCHTGALWMRPPFVRCIDKATGRKKFVLKFSSMVIRRRTEPPAEAPGGMTAFRVVGDLRREKGKSRIMLCGEPGCRMLTILKRDVNERTEVLLGVERGDIVAVDSWEERKDGWRLSAGAAVEILRRYNRTEVPE